MMLTEAAKALPQLRHAATEPAGLPGVKRVLGRRFALFPQPERSDGEWSEWWADYVDAIGHLPEGAIEAAMSAWVRSPDAEFMPKPGKLLDLARTTPNRSIKAYERAKAAMDYRPPRPPHPADADPNYIDPEVRGVLSPTLKPRVEPTQAEKDRVRAMCRQFIAQDDERKAKEAASRRGNLPDTAGPATETGITDAMKAKIAKDRAA